MTSWILILLLFIGAAGAQTQGAQTKAPPSKPVPGQGATAQQDKEMEAAIRAKLAKSKIGKDGITVRVQGGVAFWEGSTNVVQHKGAATRMAKTAGAKRVVNNIKVSDAAKETASANLDQGRRRAQVKRGEERSSQ
jgi:BON domain